MRDADRLCLALSTLLHPNFLQIKPAYNGHGRPRKGGPAGVTSMNSKERGLRAEGNMGPQFHPPCTCSWHPRHPSGLLGQRLHPGALPVTSFLLSGLKNTTQAASSHSAACGVTTLARHYLRCLHSPISVYGGISNGNLFLLIFASTALSMGTSIQQVPNKCWLYCTESHLSFSWVTPLSLYSLCPASAARSTKGLRPRRLLATGHIHREGAPCGRVRLGVWSTGKANPPPLKTYWKESFPCKQARGQKARL